MKYKKPAVFSLPAYSTVLCQQYSPDGDLLAVGNDSGRIAVYRVDDLVNSCRVDEIVRDHSSSTSSAHLFSFSAAAPDGGWGREARSGWSVLALASVGDFLLASVSNTVGGRRCTVSAFSWSDLRRKQAKVAWDLNDVGSGSAAGSAAGGGAGGLPVDINGLAVEVSDGSTGGRILVAGGGPPINPATSLQDNSVSVVDVETRSLARKPLEGHSNYIHSISMDATSQHPNLAATASEDGTGKVWDLRLNHNPCVRTVVPSEDPGLDRPALGRWVGAVALSGEWLALGGGPRPAMWHLKATSGSGNCPPTMSWNEAVASGGGAGGIHALHLVEDEDQRLVIGGELGSKVFQVSTTSNNGDILAEIPTSFGCTYSIATCVNRSRSRRILSLAGSGAEIDICAPNFNYKNKTVLFPAAS